MLAVGTQRLPRNTRRGDRFGIPSRLPAASRPNPKPIFDKHLRELGIAAKQLFPIETSFGFQVWLQFVNETGCRRAESEIDWSSIY